MGSSETELPFFLFLVFFVFVVGPQCQPGADDGGQQPYIGIHKASFYAFS